MSCINPLVVTINPNMLINWVNYTLYLNHIWMLRIIISSRKMSPNEL